MNPLEIMTDEKRNGIEAVVKAIEMTVAPGNIWGDFKQLVILHVRSSSGEAATAHFIFGSNEEQPKPALHLITEKMAEEFLLQEAKAQLKSITINQT